MKAIILAAGKGTRLKKYTKNLPKGMLEFMGKTIIERQIELYRLCGIEDIIIVKGFAGDKINYDGVKYYTNYEYEITNMVESLMVAKEEFNKDIIISYSDILFERHMLEKMIKTKGDYIISVDDNWKEYWIQRYGRIDFDTESLIIDEDNNIISIGREDPRLEDIDARYIGLLKFSKKGVENILHILNRDYKEYNDKPWKQSGKYIRQAYMTDLLQAILETGDKVKAEKFNNGWLEFDTNEDYEKACEWVKDGSINKFIDLNY
ncbi:phosphocholine cytidylyltransferase family protein [Clostridium tetani]|uniref:phosphocholine cytidylyltransferase family protein n=1 Tax=Clostridium tetani TaxID=1513 RepID=UPI00100A69BB|nr:phosphocholine cytidylyltransferase family protein [Clostridium tetani]RXM78519.1 phosphocholine cytidylyltransferase family protein [Clostridium tetani]RYU99881.1 phosphocholine cytidylyltransferase family protein [Clostridium tetani]